MRCEGGQKTLGMLARWSRDGLDQIRFRSIGGWGGAMSDGDFGMRRCKCNAQPGIVLFGKMICSHI